MVVNVNEPVVENQPPVADAGPDQTVDSEQAGVSLDGSGSSDPDGDPITYSWTQTSGPAVSLSGADTATPSFDAPVGPATLEFELTVDDGEASDTDTVVVNVNEPVVENQPPVADAGPDQTVDSEQAGVSLDGSGSSDPDGDPITYSWTQTSGPAVSLSGADTATPSFDAPVGPATLEFELTVDDGEASDTDTVVVNVNEPVVENQPPVADAGPDQTVDSEQAGVTLDGSGSTDPDGDPITYSWTQTSGPAVSLSGADTATPSFDAPVGPATLEFELTVDDGEASDTDTVVVNVNEPVVGAPTIPELIESVEGLELPRGLENSLVKKLENAQRNLDKGDDLDEACEKLGSFIDEVAAQSGKKIDPADAEALIADAEAIRFSIGCEVSNGY